MGLHESTSANLTKTLGNVLPPDAAALGADVAGGINETLSGYGALLAGRPFDSKTGYDWNDVVANRAGQERALQEGAGQVPAAMGGRLAQLVNEIAKRYRSTH